jgi:hypothetical protein
MEVRVADAYPTPARAAGRAGRNSEAPRVTTKPTSTTNFDPRRGSFESA